MCAEVFCVSSVGMFAAGWRGSAVSVRCFCRGCGEWVFLLNFEGGSLGALGAWLPWWSTISPTLFLRVNFICWFLRACTAAADSPVLQLGVPHQIRSSAATGAVLPGGGKWWPRAPSAAGSGKPQEHARRPVHFTLRTFENDPSVDLPKYQRSTDSSPTEDSKRQSQL